MKIIFFGTPSFVDPVLKVLLGNFNVIEKIREPEEFDPQSLDRIKKLNPDLFVVAAYGQILPRELLKIPKLGSINIHPSILPKYRGPTPIQSSLLDDDKKTGVTFIKMDELVDHGKILHRFEEEVFDNDTFESLSKRLFQKAAESLVDVVNNFEKGQEGKVQDEKDVTFTKMLTKQSGFIDLNNPPAIDLLNRMIRAYYPWPGAWTKFDLNGRELVVKLLPNDQIQVEGKRAMSFKDFVNGYEKGEDLLKNLSLN